MIRATTSLQQIYVLHNIVSKFRIDLKQTNILIMQGYIKSRLKSWFCKS
jgi:hypothetical protein